MKKYLLVLVAIFSFYAGQAQEKKDNKNEEAHFNVNGVCGDCKARIEENALRIKGVKFAEWNKETHDLKVAYNGQKTDLESIQKEIAKIGHDTPLVKADSTAYNNLPKCCQYHDKNNKHH